MKLVRLPLATAALLLAPGSTAFAQEHEHPRVEATELGELSFPTSCSTEVQEDFERAVAMLHSFWYQVAERAFQAVASEEPDCAMAFWGVAMSRFHQLWEYPSPDDLGAARAALDKAAAIEAVSERERAYIVAIERFYRDADRIDHGERVVAYEEAMRDLQARYPDDSEAAVFHALALLATAASHPPDPTFARQREAGAILEGLLASRPQHPGVAHYLIHATDYPALAGHGLEAARRYAAIAPGAPHALHMPSHIFTRLGLWEESIASNRAASTAARDAGWIGEELHVTDYLVYARLQRAQDGEVARILETLPERVRELTGDDSNYQAGLYAVAAIPARHALERRQWEVAAALEIPHDVLPGGGWCWAEAPLHVARGLGAVHTGDLEAARRSIEELGACREILLTTEDGDVTVPVPLWANRLEAQRQGLAAWLALAEGKDAEALGLMRSAAELEDAGDKPPVTPGSVVPMRELLGEMLLEMGLASEALAEFQRALETAPNRFRSLYGAALAAELAGNLDVARRRYGELLEVAQAADAERMEVRQARHRAAEL